MKIMDKYELALVPNGTPFYELDKWGNIKWGLSIHLGHHFVGYDGKPMFNGVCYLEPDRQDENYGQFNKDNLPTTFELFSVDTDSNDFDDDDRFLVLEAEELKIIIDYLLECYNNIKGNKNEKE